MNLVFMGTPQFAVPPLKALIKAGHTVSGVFTQPDKPKGRGKKVSAPPVKEAAVLLGIPVFQPHTLKDESVAEQLKALAPDAIVVVAYGKLLPKTILDIPAYGCINIHASLLPHLRGAAPIQWSILNGDTQSGVTTMLMEEGLDTGAILLQAKTPIDPKEDAAQLYDRLSELGAELIVKTLDGLQSASISPKKQRDEEASYAPMLGRELSEIDWNKPALQIYNQIRGLQPWPVACTVYEGKRLKIYRAQLLEGPAPESCPGRLCEEGGLIVCCGDGRMIELIDVQLDGSKRMPAADMLRGHPVTNKQLG